MNHELKSQFPHGDQPAKFSVAVLAGGQSQRMGVDKSQIRLTPEGPTLLESVIAIATGLTEDCFVVSRSARDHPGLDAPIIGDRYPGTGPLGAIATGIASAHFDRTLVLSCDMPFLSADALRWMALINPHTDIVIPVTSGQSRQDGERIFQTMHAIYRKTCLPAIATRISAADLGTTSYFADVVVTPVEASEFLRFDPTLSMFYGVNTPEELKEARAIHVHKLSSTGKQAASARYGIGEP